MLTRRGWLAAWVASHARSAGSCFSTEACFTPSSLSSASRLAGSVVTVINVPFDALQTILELAAASRGGLLKRRIAGSGWLATLAVRAFASHPKS